MTVEFGLAMRYGPPKGQLNRWVDDLDQLLPQLEGHIHGIWMTDHFQWDDDPTFEAWTALAFAAGCTLASIYPGADCIRPELPESGDGCQNGCHLANAV